MDSLKRVLERIERRLKVVKLTANAASKKAGKPDAIRNMRRAVENGDRQSANMATIAALAPILETTAAWLTEAAGPEEVSAEEATIPVWGKAGAGGKVHLIPGTPEIGRIPDPGGSNERTGSIEIDGESLGKVWDGWYAVYDEIRHPPTQDLIGRLCVLEDSKGQVFVKRLKKGRGKRWTLESSEEPIYDVEVKWAAPVKNVVPP